MAGYLKTTTHDPKSSARATDRFYSDHVSDRLVVLKDDPINSCCDRGDRVAAAYGTTCIQWRIQQQSASRSSKIVYPGVGPADACDHHSIRVRRWAEVYRQVVPAAGDLDQYRKDPGGDRAFHAVA